MLLTTTCHTNYNSKKANISFTVGGGDIGVSIGRFGSVFVSIIKTLAVVSNRKNRVNYELLLVNDGNGWNENSFANYNLVGEGIDVRVVVLVYISTYTRICIHEGIHCIIVN